MDRESSDRSCVWVVIHPNIHVPVQPHQNKIMANHAESLSVSLYRPIKSKMCPRTHIYNQLDILGSSNLKTYLRHNSIIIAELHWHWVLPVVVAAWARGFSARNEGHRQTADWNRAPQAGAGKCHIRKTSHRSFTVVQSYSGMFNGSDNMH